MNRYTVITKHIFSEAPNPENATLVCLDEDVAKLEAENIEYHEHVSELSRKLRKAAEENERLSQTLQNQADRIAEYIKGEMEYKRRLKALEK